jgi:FkbH-like protein/FkbM family methyltransferase
MSNPLLGEQIESANGSYTWETGLEIASLAYLQDHSLQGVLVLPGAAYVEMALAAYAAAFGRTPEVLEAVEFHRMLFLPENGRYLIELFLSANDDGHSQFKVCSRAVGAERADLPPHATINIPADMDCESSSAADKPELEEILAQCPTPKSGAEFYAELASNGNQYGPDFRAVEHLWLGDGKSLAALRVPARIEQQLESYHLHPILLDSAAQIILAAAGSRKSGTYLLAGIDRVRFRASPGARGWAFARLLSTEQQDYATLVGDVWLLDESGQLAAELLGVRFKHLSHALQSNAKAQPAATIAITATFTAEPLEESLAFWMKEFQAEPKIVFAPYNQVFQQLLDPSSLLNLNTSGLNVILVRLEDWMRSDYAQADAALAGNRERLLAGHARHRLPNQMEIAHLNEYETDYLYEEIFTNQTYLKCGISLNDGDCVIDVGANIGMFTLFVKQRFKGAKVYAFEPAPPAFEALSINTALHCPDAILFDCGLSDKNQEASFTFYNKSSVFSGFHADPEQDRAALKRIVENVIRERASADAATSGALADELIEGRLQSDTYLCRLRTLSSVIREHQIGSIDLLKVDAERSEMEVLGGIEEEDWGIIKQIVIEAHDKQGEQSKRIVRLLEEKGFDVITGEEELLSGSGLINLYAKRPTKIDQQIAQEPLASQTGRKLEHIIEDLIGALKMIEDRSAAASILCVCPPSPALLSDTEQMNLLARFEQRLGSELRHLKSVYFMGSSDLLFAYQISDYYDPHADELGHVPYTMRFYTALGTMIARKYLALRRAPFKVITLDCDQTLWEGVCGEDGPAGIRIDEPRRRLQEFVIAQHDAGMLLCICSKNNEEDVMAVFDHHPEMPLTRDRILRYRLNWKPKSENIKSLARELNLGLESFIHIDDNPVECAEVEANCPEVLTLQLPAVACDIPRFLDHVWAFDRLGITEEDERRASHYQQNFEREGLRKSSLTFGSFLAGLQLEVRIFEPTPHHLARAAQLTERTNQFNFTTVRRSQAELKEILNSGTFECLVVDASDRFGDYGMVGIILFKADSEAIAVDTFLLSCRALGKGIEHRMMARLGKVALERGIGRVEIPFISSGKNQSALEFLDTIAARFKEPLARGDTASSQPAQIEDSRAGFIFKVPSNIVAETAFDPDSSGAIISSGDEGHESGARSDEANPASDESGARDDASLLRRIAIEFNDVDHILNLVESKKQREKVSPPRPFEAPGNEVERVLKNIWQEVLGVDEVSITDNFFELGGTSLEAVLVISELKKRLDVDLSTISLFDKTTISSMAGMMKSGSEEEWGERIESNLRRGEKRRAKNLARLRHS